MALRNFIIQPWIIFYHSYHFIGKFTGNKLLIFFLRKLSISTIITKIRDIRVCINSTIIVL